MCYVGVRSLVSLHLPFGPSSSHPTRETALLQFTVLQPDPEQNCDKAVTTLNKLDSLRRTDGANPDI